MSTRRGSRAFLLGVALSPHQTEGEPVDSDWWRAARAGLVPDPGEALSFLERYREDFATIQALGLSAVRFGVEWARLEPMPGTFDERALGRYADMVEAAEEAGLQVLLTLHHFTLPGWLAERGGILSEEAPSLFARFAEVVARRLPPPAFYLTVNEPLVLAAMGYLFARWPPFRRSMPLALSAALTLVRWHRLAYARLKAIRPEVPVGVVHHFLAFRGKGVGRTAACLADFLFHRAFLTLARPFDVLGVNYYTCARLGPGFQIRPPAQPVTEMGWEVYPEGLATALETALSFGCPVIVTENGIATADDELRRTFLKEHLAVVARMRHAGRPVLGYLYWTLYDNYEWAEGYQAHFGLGDRMRRLRPSAYALRSLWEEAIRVGS